MTGMDAGLLIVIIIRMPMVSGIDRKDILHFAGDFA